MFYILRNNEAIKITSIQAYSYENNPDENDVIRDLGRGGVCGKEQAISHWTPQFIQDWFFGVQAAATALIDSNAIAFAVKDARGRWYVLNHTAPENELLFDDKGNKVSLNDN